MNGCTETGKPLVSILMAVYEPRPDWLRQQLRSLEAQTYPNLRLILRDDASSSVTAEELRTIAGECIRSFPVTVERNETNLGSNATFELLTAEAEGDYLCFCDQDDVWYPEKTETLLRTLEETGSLLVCSDMVITDGAGKRLADSMTELRRHHVFRSGEGLSAYLWNANFASGCAMLVRADTAKAAIPFNPYLCYDHYVTLWCAAHGRVTSLARPLLEHREHGDNQSTLLHGVTDKESYIRIRIEQRYASVLWLRENFPCDEPLKRILPDAIGWLEARRAYARGDRAAGRTMRKYRSLGRGVTAFELALPCLPESVIPLLVKLGRKNLL